jgi:metal-sulfur cluster biosynthetic enzyme
MPEISEIHTALERVVDPCSIATGHPINLPDMGMIKSIIVEGDEVTVALRLTSPICWQAANIISKVEEVVSEVTGVCHVRCVLDPEQDWMPDMIAPAAAAGLRRLRPMSALA